MPAVRNSRLPSSGWACRSRRHATSCASMLAAAASMAAPRLLGLTRVSVTIFRSGCRLLDRRRAGLAGDFVLRAGAPRAADRADHLAAFDERNAATRGDDAIECDQVGKAGLDAGLENLGLAPESCCAACLVL